MALSLAKRSATVRHLHTARNMRAKRQYLRAVLKVDAGIVAATPDARIDDLIDANRMHQLELATSPHKLAAIYDECEPDEIASVLTFAMNRLVEPHEVHAFDPRNGGDAA